MCLHLWNDCPSGISSKKAKARYCIIWYPTSSVILLCRNKSKYYSKSKYFINRSFLIICWSRENWKLTYSWYGVLPAAHPWNKPKQQHKRNENLRMSLKDTGILKWSSCIAYWNSSGTKIILLLRLSLKNHWSVLSWTHILAKAFTSNNIFMPRLLKWTLYSVCLVRMLLLMISDVSWCPPHYIWCFLMLATLNQI